MTWTSRTGSANTWNARARTLRTLVPLVLAATAAVAPANKPDPILPGDLLVIDRDTLGEPQRPNRLRGAVLEVDLDTGLQTKLASDGPFLGPQDGDFAPDGTFHVVDRTTPTGEEGGAVFRVNLHSGEKHLVSDLQHFRNPRTITWDGDFGRFLVVDPYALIDGASNSGGVIAVDRFDGTQEVVCVDERFRSPVGLVREPEGTFLVIDERAGARKSGVGTTGTVFRWDPQSEEVTELATDDLLVRPRHGTIGPDGDLYLADWSSDPERIGAPPHLTETGSIIRIDRTTGAQTLVSGGGEFLRPFACAFLEDGTFLVADRGLNNPDPRRGRIFGVDVETGVQTVVSSDQYFYQCVGLSIVPDWYPEVVAYVEPIVEGDRMRAEVAGGEPGKRIALCFSDARGTVHYEALDLTIDLSGPLTIVEAIADDCGVATFDVKVPAWLAAGETIYLQAVALESRDAARTGLVLERVIQAP